MALLLPDILSDVRVSYFAHMTHQPEATMPLAEALDWIRSDKYRSTIEEIRRCKAEGNDERARAIKGNLPAVTFSATFREYRRSDAYEHYNSLLGIDIDKLDDTEMKRIGKCLNNDPYVAAYWKSPSGNGWKGLVVLAYPDNAEEMEVVEKHHSAFRYVEAYFKTNYAIELDVNCKDITRLCFFSWDPKLIVKSEIQPMPVTIEKKEKVVRKKTLSITKIKPKRAERVTAYPWKLIEGRSEMHNNEHDRKKIERIYKYLNRHHLSITGNYADWSKVAYAVANTFHPAYGRKIYMKLCELDGAMHDAERSESLIYSAYATSDIRTEFASIIYLAKGKGYGA